VYADLVLLNAKVVNVFSGEIVDGSIAVRSGRIWRVGSVDDVIGDSTRTIDVGGRYVCPGFIDAHIHVESSMLTIRGLAKAVVPHGTTSIVIDPHEIANVLGVDGVKMFIDESEGIPLDVYVTIPSCVPATADFETSGATIGLDDVRGLLGFRRVVGLGEVMDFLGVINRNPTLMGKISMVRERGLRVDGHAPSLSGKLLQEYVSVGVHSDHECVDGFEALEKLRCGMWIMVREGSLSKDLNRVLGYLVRVGVDLSRVMLVTDDLNPMDAFKSHMNKLVRMAIECGCNPIDAIRMVTLNPALYYRLDDEIGAVAPGLKANLVVLDDLKTINVYMTIFNGVVVAKNGNLTVDIGKWDYPPRAYRTMNLKKLPSTDDFAIKVGVECGRAIVNVIGVEEATLYTKHLTAELNVEGGKVIPSVDDDVIQVAVVERHKATGNIGLGFVKGFGLKFGAIASSISHDSHNIVVVGVNWSDMAYAVKCIVENGGGIVAVKGGSILEILPLPIAGLMSNLDVGEVSAKLERLYEASKILGCRLKEPFMTLSFIALSVIPEIRLTDRGLILHDPLDKSIRFIDPVRKFIKT
jgi:adenine deaminase